MPQASSYMKWYLLVLLFVPSLIYSQTIFWEETFDQDVIPPGWSTQSLNNSPAEWRPTGNGTADQGQYWDNRPPINSPSGNPAIMFDSDGSATNGDFFPHHAELRSEIIDITSVTSAKVGLQFYQYYRNLQATTTVGVSVDGGNSWQDYTVNESVGLNVETEDSSMVTIDITDNIASAGDNIIIRFIFEGSNYFWIIDDIRLIELSDTFGETFPPELGDSLEMWDLPYKVDSLGGAYVPNELVVKFEEGFPEEKKEELREKYNVVSYDTCFCAGPELWILPDVLEADLGENLLVDGSFEETFVIESSLPQNCSCGSGSYCLGTQMTDKCDVWSSNNFTAAEGDRFLIVDGLPGSTALLWQQPNITVEQDSQYVFIFQARNFQNAGLPVLSLMINDGGGYQAVASVQPDAVDEWGQYVMTWQSPADMTVFVGLEQSNFGSGIGGFDYGLDDFYFGQIDGEKRFIGIEKDKKKLTEEAGPEGLDFNYYAFGELEDQPTDPINSIPDVDQGEPAPCDVLIAVLDTGVDYEYNSTNLDITPFIWQNNDMQCFDDDFVGWNFVEDSNNPYDPNGHGTHVAGIIAQTLLLPGTTGLCNVKLMPIAAGDEHGILTLFRATCGIYYATAHDADLINASWGFYGVQEDNNNNPMRNAIEYAATENNIIFINSAGNQDVDIAIKPHYPSNYSLSNIITVGSVDSVTYIRSDFSNFSSTFVDFYAFGNDIFSALPPGLYDADWEARSGTSMAAPAVTGAIARLLCKQPLGQDTIVDILDCIADLISDAPDNLAVIDPILTDSCYLIVDTDSPGTAKPLPLKYGPNPVRSTLWISPGFDAPEGLQINIFSTTGQLMQSRRIGGTFRGDRQAIDFSRLPPGMYALQLVYKEHRQTVRIIKQ
jgi:hypothetical protein